MSYAPSRNLMKLTWIDRLAIVWGGALWLLLVALSGVQHLVDSGVLGTVLIFAGFPWMLLRGLDWAAGGPTRRWSPYGGHSIEARRERPLWMRILRSHNTWILAICAIPMGYLTFYPPDGRTWWGAPVEFAAVLALLGLWWLASRLADRWANRAQMPVMARRVLQIAVVPAAILTLMFAAFLL